MEQYFTVRTEWDPDSLVSHHGPYIDHESFMNNLTFNNYRET